jgi:hypothetical protein
MRLIDSASNLTKKAFIAHLIAFPSHSIGAGQHRLGSTSDGNRHNFLLPEALVWNASERQQISFHPLGRGLPFGNLVFVSFASANAIYDVN